MPDQLQLRGGTTTEHNSFTGALREVTVDTTKKTLVVHDGSQAGGTPLMRESGSNAASSVQIGSGGVNALTIDGSQDVTLTGASANVVWDKSENSLEFADNAKLTFGSGNKDFAIFHDGNNTYLTEQGDGTGQVYLRANSIELLNNSNAIYAKFLSGASVELYHNGTKRIETTSTGVLCARYAFDTDNYITCNNTSNTMEFVIGDANVAEFNSTALTFPDSKELRLGSSADLKLYHTGNSIIQNTNGAVNLVLMSDYMTFRGNTANEDYIKCIPNGAVELYNDNSRKIYTSTNGIVVESGTPNLEIYAITDDADAKLTLVGKTPNGGVGQAGRVEIVGESTSTNSGGSAMHLRTRKTNNTVTTAITIDQDQDVTLPIDNQKLRLGAGNDLRLFHDSTNSVIDNTTGELQIKTDAIMRLNSTEYKFNNAADTQIIARFIQSGANELYFDHSKKLYTDTDGVVIGGPGYERLKIDGQVGDCILASSGAEIQFTRNSENNITCTGASSSLKINLNSKLAAKYFANGAAQHFYNGVMTTETGDSQLKIYGRSGINSTLYLISDEGGDAGESWRLMANGENDDPIFSLTNNPDGNWEQSIEATGNGSVKLFYNNSPKCFTTSWGFQISGDLLPHGDNSRKLGESNERWSIVYAANGTIQTSDKNEKNTIVESDLGLDFVNKLKPVSYKWNKDDGKTHYGLIAQDVEETITSLGKTIADFGGVHKESSSMGLGYTELISPLIKAVQELSDKVAALEAA